MSTKKNSVLLVILIVFLTQGCGLVNNDLIKNGVVSTITLPAKNYQLQNLKIFHVHNGTSISGEVIGHKSGHIDILVYDANNDLLTKAAANIKHIHRSRSDSRQSHFSITIPEYLIEGSKVSFAYHSGRIEPGCTEMEK